MNVLWIFSFYRKKVTISRLYTVHCVGLLEQLVRVCVFDIVDRLFLTFLMLQHLNFRWEHVKFAFTKLLHINHLTECAKNLHFHTNSRTNLLIWQFLKRDSIKWKIPRTFRPKYSKNVLCSYLFIILDGIFYTYAKIVDFSVQLTAIKTTNLYEYFGRFLKLWMGCKEILIISWKFVFNDPEQTHSKPIL